MAESKNTALVYRDVLDMIESFEPGERGFMYCLRAFSPDTPLLGYIPAMWEDFQVGELPILQLKKWYSFPYFFRLRANSVDTVELYEGGYPVRSFEQVHTYEAGYHIEISSEDKPLPLINRWPMVWVAVKFKDVLATGWRRGNRVAVARDIRLIGEI